MLLSDLVYDVRPDVAGAPDFTIRDALQKSAVEFFYESQCWTQQLDPITLTNGTYLYDLSLPSDAVLLRLYDDGRFSGVKIDRRCLKLVPEWKLFDASRNATDTGEPSYVAVNTAEGNLMVWPTPDAAAAGKQISVLAVLGVTRQVTEIPEAIGLRWQEAFVSRAKARLMNTAGKPWSNPDQGAMELRIYRAKVASARAEAHTGQYAGPQRIQFTPFA